jgi:acyl-coenzyme A thioesterase PaaI-like protein
MTTREAWHKQLTTEVTNVSIHRHLSLILLSQTPINGVPTARLEFTSTPRHLVNTGSVHGGISSLIIDAACFLAVIPTLEVGQGTATVASSFQILGSVKGEGKKYEVGASMVKRGRSVVFCEGEVRCEGMLVARGNLTKIITSGENEVKSKL